MFSSSALCPTAGCDLSSNAIHCPLLSSYLTCHSCNLFAGIVIKCYIYIYIQYITNSHKGTAYFSTSLWLRLSLLSGFDGKILPFALNISFVHMQPSTCCICPRFCSSQHLCMFEHLSWATSLVWGWMVLLGDNLAPSPGRKWCTGRSALLLCLCSHSPHISTVKLRWHIFPIVFPALYEYYKGPRPGLSPEEPKKRAYFINLTCLLPWNQCDI